MAGLNVSQVFETGIWVFHVGSSTAYREGCVNITGRTGVAVYIARSFSVLPGIFTERLLFVFGSSGFLRPSSPLSPSPLLYTHTHTPLIVPTTSLVSYRRQPFNQLLLLLYGCRDSRIVCACLLSEEKTQM